MAKSPDTSTISRPEPPGRLLIRLLQLAMASVIASFVVLYLYACFYMYSIQTSLIYVGANQPVPLEVAIREAKDKGLVPWDRTTPGATAPQGYVRPNFTAAAPRGTIIFFHGNGGWSVDRVWYEQSFSRRGFRVFFYEYPGYGGRPGKPSEAAIVPDAQALIRSLDQDGYGPIYIWGESLGSGVAAAVCADKTLPVHGLALIAPWDSFINVNRSRVPWLPIRLIMVDQYETLVNLQHFAGPICVIRGDFDDVIPPPLTLNLFARLPEPKKMILQAGYGHINWPSDPELSWWDDALNFIAPGK